MTEFKFTQKIYVIKIEYYNIFEIIKYQMLNSHIFHDFEFFIEFNVYKKKKAINSI